MPQFSKNTIIEVIDALNFREHADIENFVGRFSLESVDSNGGIKPRTVAIKRYLIDTPGLKGPSGSDIVFEIIEHLFHQRRRQQKRSHLEDEEIADAYPDLVRSLSRDGFLISGNNLVRALPTAIGFPDVEDELSLLLDSFRFVVAKGHMEQAMSAFTRGEWAAANGQLRSFIESLFDNVALVVDKQRASQLPTSHERRRFLVTVVPPFFLADYNEWTTDRNQPGFIQGFWNRLHPQGSHPGLSDEDDCTFRMQLVLLTASHFMRRLRDREDTSN